MGGGKDSVGGQAFGSWTEQDSQEGFDLSRWATARARALAARVVLPEQIPAMTLDDLVNAFDSIPQAVLFISPCCHEVIEDPGCGWGVCARVASASGQGCPRKMRRTGVTGLHGRRLALAEGGIGGLAALMHSDFRPEGHVKDSGLAALESSKRFLPGHV